jgi:VWFA-related protein
VIGTSQKADKEIAIPFGNVMDTDTRPSTVVVFLTFLVISLGLSTLCVAEPIHDASKNQPPAERSQIAVQVSAVSLFATVRDKKGDLVPNLTKDDFRVYEDGRPQQIALFSDRVAGPLTVGLLLDTSRSERKLLSDEQDMASRFVHEVLGGGDMAAIIGFDSEVTLLTDLTENPSILEHAIHKTEIQPPQKDASTAFYDAIYLACHELRDQAGRKILLIVSDAEDSGSHVTMREAIEAVQRANSVIYVLRIADPQFSTGYGFGSRGDIVAQIIARETGGRMFDIRTQENLDNALRQISIELRSQYMVGYYPTNTKHNGAFRKVRVDVKMPNVSAFTRRGYFAPKD